MFQLSINPHLKNLPKPRWYHSLSSLEAQLLLCPLVTISSLSLCRDFFAAHQQNMTLHPDVPRRFQGGGGHT